jgi:hypothetical protein
MEKNEGLRRLWSNSQEAIAFSKLLHFFPPKFPEPQQTLCTKKKEGRPI